MQCESVLRFSKGISPESDSGATKDVCFLHPLKIRLLEYHSSQFKYIWLICLKYCPSHSCVLSQVEYMLLANFCQKKQIFKTLIIVFQQQKLHILKIPQSGCFKHITNFIIFLQSFKRFEMLVLEMLFPLMLESQCTAVPKDSFILSFCPYTTQVSSDADQPCTATLGFCTGIRLE